MYQYAAKVLSVHDGDTLTLEVDLGFNIFQVMTIRLYGPDPDRNIGINAPELNTIAGKEAKQALKVKLDGVTDLLLLSVKDRKEKYGRYLGVLTATEITAEGEKTVNINEWMLEKGYATLKKY